MYELYIGNKNYSSWSLRPWVLMRELGIAFAEHVVAFDPGTSWTKFRAFSPSGKVPCLVDGGTVVWDSLGITEYLAERHAGVWPRRRRSTCLGTLRSRRDALAGSAPCATPAR